MSPLSQEAQAFLGVLAVHSPPSRLVHLDLPREWFQDSYNIKTITITHKS